MILVLACISIVAVLLAAVQPRWDGRLAWMLGGVLMYFAASRIAGYDHVEYVDIIEGTRALVDADIRVRIAAAKDPLFLLIIDFTGWFSDDPRLVFALVALVGVSSKVIASAALRGRRTAFLAAYAVFLSPGLEFAAIRTGLAVGLILLSIVSVWRWRHAWMVLGLASHMSTIVVPMGQFFATHRRTGLLVAALAVPVALPVLLQFASEDPRFINYFDNRGSIFAFIWPALTLLAWVPARRLVLTRARRHPLLAPAAIGSTSFSIGLALLLTLPMVQVSFRILELAWVLMLGQMIALSSIDASSRRTPNAYVSWAALFTILSLVNVVRGTWSAMLPLTA